MPWRPRCGPAAIWCRIWGCCLGALRAQSAAQIRAFEEVFEPLGLTALAIQVLTGLWMGWIYMPGFRGLLSPANPIGMPVGVKLLLLAGTAALAIAFVAVGGLIRLGGLG